MPVYEWPVATLSELARLRTCGFSTGEGHWPFRGFLVLVGNRVYAYTNVCPHQGHPLDYEPHRFLAPDGHQLLCSSHGALFDPATGLCSSGPCKGMYLRSLPCRVDGEQIYVTAPGSRCETSV